MAQRARSLTVLAVALALVLAALPARARPPARSDRFMVSTANPLATMAARSIILKGGSAVDATIAAEMVLTLTEPQSSGLGGGSFMLHYEAATRKIVTLDGREKAPAAATPDLFRRPDGTLMTWREAARGGLPVGVPGTLRMLELAHQKWGKLPWAELFQPAIRLAQNGFLISPRLYEVLSWIKHPERYPAFYRMYFDADGRRKAIGTRLTDPRLAASLRAIAAGGADAFYKGKIAKEIVDAVRNAQVNPSNMTLQDLASYRAIVRPPVCVTYRVWRVCGMGPPSSGGIAVAQILLLLERFDMAEVKPSSLQAVHLISEAERLAYADRDRYLADSDFVAVPVRQLLDKAYLARRSALIDPSRDMGTAKAGDIPGFGDRPQVSDAGNLGYSTSHISIVDPDGNAVSMTSSIDRGFGSRLMAGGFMLNNELTDFTFQKEVDGKLVANRPQGGKRPRSSMAPTLVLDKNGRLVMAIGTVGGSSIICYVANTLIAKLDWGLNIQAAIELPHHVNKNGETVLEAKTPLVALIPQLEAMGHKVSTATMTTGLQGFYIDANGIITGGADPRREGVAIGR